MTRLDEALDRLVERGVLDREQADAVRAEVRSGDGQARSTVSPLAEIAGYVGGILTLSATMALVLVRLEDASDLVRALVVGLLAALLVWAGAAMRDPAGRDPVRRRMSGTMWSIAVVLTGIAAGLLSFEGRDGGTVVTQVGAAALVLAVVLYTVQRSVGQLVTMVLAGVLTLVGLGLVADLGPAGTGLLVAVLGGGVAAGGVSRVLPPWQAAVPVGSLVVLAGVQTMAFSDEWRGIVLVVAMGVCVALFALATRLGIVLSSVATLGLTATVPQAISHFVGDSAPLPLVLLTGLALLGGAAVTTRMRR